MTKEERAQIWKEVADFVEMTAADHDDIWDCAQFIEKTGLDWLDYVQARRAKEES